MVGNYPPGAANDPRAPWNEPERIECDECGGIYERGGHRMIRYEKFEGEEVQTVEIPCPNEGKTRTDYEEEQEAARQEMLMDERRLQER